MSPRSRKVGDTHLGAISILTGNFKSIFMIKFLPVFIQFSVGFCSRYLPCQRDKLFENGPCIGSFGKFYHLVLFVIAS